ncbi:MAG: hypothetical protein E6J89_11735 [Deltaproteobacteria bacterium]|nr:MAG: hypothetical protein E6J89_11735 [Deltaproteobacteria bacterium]
MAEENPPKDREKENQANTESERIGEQIGAPLRHISSKFTSLIDEIINEIKADNEKHERRSRNDYQPTQFFWLRFSAIASVVLSFCSLLLAGLTFIVLNKALGVMDKQRETVQRQLGTVARQLKEMQSAGTQTDKVIRAAQDSADAAAKSAETADKTFKSSERSFRMTMRPYITVKSIQIRDFTPGKRFAVETTIENAGKTPALDMVFTSKLEIGDKNLSTDTNYDLSGASKGTLGGGRTSSSTLRGPSELQQEMFDAVNEGQLKIMAQGKVTYKDIFTQKKAAFDPYETTFCFYYDHITTQQMATCPIGNSVK